MVVLRSPCRDETQIVGFVQQTSLPTEPPPPPNNFSNKLEIEDITMYPLLA